MPIDVNGLFPAFVVQMPHKNKNRELTNALLFSSFCKT
ncbi:hypothetical protein C900_01295 [Fulvivirga imtechensis AK7]|uniref:Uncharacterized protein n=1 Tax=Fulvivirga imtechensis AK7 TaxID=1237149 RepID=L8JZ94_9BACT|nr:hypothetical protein C900_01295 [Fulvivirga imtechensis AK7]